MNTLITKKLRAGTVGLTLVSACVLALPVYAQDSTVTVKSQKPSKQENIGVVTGLAVGAAAGGPIGAIIGAGAWIGDRYHKQLEAKKALANDLSQSEAQKVKLTQDVTELNTSLAQAHSKSDQLDLTLRKTEELQT